MNWAVPVFFMITGALLLNPLKEITIEKSVEKYAMRIFYPLFFWGIIYAFLKLLSNEKRIGFYLIPKSIEYVIEGKSFSHLWYLYVLVGIYLILPLIKSYINYCSKRDIKTLLFILFIMDFIFPFVTKVTSIDIAFKLSLTYPFFYLILGYFIWHCIDNSRTNNIYILYIISLGIIIVLNYMSLKYSFIAEYNSPFIAILAGGIFLKGKEIKTSILTEKNIWKFDRLCFGIYLIHPMFVQFSYRLIKANPTNFSPYIVASFVFWIIFVGLSTIIIWIMHKLQIFEKFI